MPRHLVAERRRAVGGQFSNQLVRKRRNRVGGLVPVAFFLLRFRIPALARVILGADTLGGSVRRCAPLQRRIT
jgi:hypothetical protein